MYSHAFYTFPVSFVFCILFIIIFLLVGGIIHGRIVIDENPNRPKQVPIGCILTVQLQDASVVGSISSILKQAEFSHFASLPAFYEIEIPTAISPAGSYVLTAQITKNEAVLFSTEKPIPVEIDPHSSIQMNILVVDLREGLNYFMKNRKSLFLNLIDEATRQWFKRRRELSWPEMIGKKGEDAVKYIKEKTGE